MNDDLPDTGAPSFFPAHEEMPVVSARALTRVFAGKNASVTALSSLNLDVPAGRMTAVVGPDGAG